MQEEKGIIQSNEKIAKDTYRMKIAAGMAKDMKPAVLHIHPRCAP